MLKALSFGTGVFLRAFFCDFADRAGIPVTMTSSTPDGDRRAAAMNAVGGRFVLAYRGKDTEGNVVDSWRTVETVERVIPSTDWQSVLALAHDPEYSLIVSNVSEAGFRRADNPTDDTMESPRSFPARLTRWLFERWQTLGENAGVTILPCELFSENGSKLREMLTAVTNDWQLPTGFVDYLREQVVMPDTLVDRIVPGEPSAEERVSVWNERLGTDANLPLIISEPFALWALRGDVKLAETLLALVVAGAGSIVVSDSIDRYVQKKVRFLNGLHSAMAAIGPNEYGVTTVREAVEHPELGPLLHSALFSEILPAMVPPLTDEDARGYAETTWARFTNPFLEHKLADINKGAAAKWPVRIYPTIETYRERFGSEPPVLSRCKTAFDTYIAP